MSEGACPDGHRATAAEPVVSALRDGIPSAWLPFRCRVKAGRAVSDPEKLVTPGVVYVSKRGPDLTVRLVAVGWWDWHVSFMFAWRTAQGIETEGADAKLAAGDSLRARSRSDAP
jgi:hypothetical protein